MLVSLQIVTVILVAFAMTPALAHALEFPGKRRLSKNVYVAVQKVYYPGFTLAGVAEPVAIIATLVLLFVTPPGHGPFWLTLFALLCLIGMHAVYWLVTHPVNKVWLEGEKLSESGVRFFSTASGSGQSNASNPGDWKQLRDRWEHSHVARAILAALALIVLLIALSRTG